MLAVETCYKSSCMNHEASIETRIKISSHVAGPVGTFALALAFTIGACGGSSSPSRDANPSPVPTIDANPDAPDANPDTPPADAAPNTPQIDAAPPDGLTDEFTGASLGAEWNITRGDLIDVSVSDGQLHLVVNTDNAWYQNDAGAALWKAVPGNFKATTSVSVRKNSDRSQLPGPNTYQFGGLLAFNPNESSGYNYVFTVLGDRYDGIQVEYKTTTNSESTVSAVNWPSGDAELRLCRVGDTFTLYRRAVGDNTWTESISYERPDLPSTVSVGPFAYAFSLPNPDLRASFERFRIEPVSSQDECAVD